MRCALTRTGQGMAAMDNSSSNDNFNSSGNNSGFSTNLSNINSNSIGNISTVVIHGSVTSYHVIDNSVINDLNTSIIINQRSFNSSKINNLNTSKTIGIE